MEVVRKFRPRGVKSLLDLLCLSALSEREMTVYEVMALIYKKFGVLLSPGTIYPRIAYLEKSGLILTVGLGRKKTYTLTDKGKDALQSWLKELDEMLFDLRSFLRVFTKKELSTNLVEA
ncbi:MAG: PadR family transcriptional regulator [archaeon]|nr:PadR family transcriptional regulator [archaeon]